MQKYIILTSILALTACGGGSGGGGSHASGTSHSSAAVVPSIPDGFRSAIAPEMVASNNVITSMKSEVVVASNHHGSSQEVARASSMAGDNGYTFTSYRLDDVKFYVADSETTDNGYLKLGIDEDGKIDKMYMVVGGVGANADAGIARDGETSTFEAAIFEYVTDSYAKVGNDEFVMLNTLEDATTKMQEAVESKYNLSGGQWEQDGDSNWLYRESDGVNFAQWDADGDGNPEPISVPNTTNDMERTIKNVYGFDKGKWVEDGGNLKYIEYGDEAVYRMVGTDTTTMAVLNAKAEELNLDGLHHWNRTDEILPVVTYGDNIDGNGAKLQYSDFGSFNPVYRTKRVDLRAGNESSGYAGWSNDGQTKTHTQQEIDDELAVEDFQLFAGGYAIKGSSMAEDRPSLDPVNGTTYKGMAIGRVYTSIHGGDTPEHKEEILTAHGITSGDGHDIAKAFTTYEATMTISKSGNNIVQTLNMPFYSHANGDKYYDINIVKNGNDIGTPTFTAADETQIASQYRLHDADDHWDMETKSFKPGYYGVNTPSEAAGTMEIRAGYDLEYGAERDYEVQAAYGLKKQ